MESLGHRELPQRKVDDETREKHSHGTYFIMYCDVPVKVKNEQAKVFPK